MKNINFILARIFGKRLFGYAWDYKRKKKVTCEMYNWRKKYWVWKLF